MKFYIKWLPLLLLIFIVGCTQVEKSPSEITKQPQKIIVNENKIASEKIIDNQTILNTTKETSEIDTSKERITEEGCYESDGGSFDKIKGFVTDLSNKTFFDTCINEQSLKEYFCGPYGYKDDKIITCDLKCVEGICIEGETLSKCKDDDFSDIYTKGSVTYKEKTTYDYCENSNTLMEQICSSVDIANEKKIICEGDCQNGKCIKIIESERKTCSDPDVGSNAQYIKSSVVDQKGTHTDECLNQYTVKEYYCNSFGYNANKNINCGNKCQDGACIK